MVSFFVTSYASLWDFASKISKESGLDLLPGSYFLFHFNVFIVFFELSKMLGR